VARRRDVGLLKCIAGLGVEGQGKGEELMMRWIIV
jgi:hypothetical protein